MSKRLSALAQLVAIYAEQGIVRTADLVEKTGYTDRAIRKARAELECRKPEPECRNQSAATGTQVPKIGTTVPPNPEPEFRPLARAYKESTHRVDTLSEKIDSLATSADAELPARKRAKIPPLDTRLPSDWVLPPAWQTWALENLSPDATAVAAEADKFRDYWLSAPGAKGRKRDWAATWRNWCRNAKPPPRRAGDELPAWQRERNRQMAEVRAVLETLN